MKEIYTDYARYNLWANRRMADAFASLTEADQERRVESSFPSAKLTFLHIWDAEYLWLQRLQGVSPQTFPSRTFQGTAAEAVAVMLDCSADFQRYVEDLPPALFDKTLHFKTISFGEQSQKAHEMIHHCLNHSTYHRGQLVTIGRQLGLINIPATDFMYYLRIEKNKV